MEDVFHQEAVVLVTETMVAAAAANFEVAIHIVMVHRREAADSTIKADDSMIVAEIDLASIVIGVHRTVSMAIMTAHLG